MFLLLSVFPIKWLFGTELIGGFYEILQTPLNAILLVAAYLCIRSRQNQSIFLF